MCVWTNPVGLRARLWLKHVDLLPQNRHELDYLVHLLDDLGSEIDEVNEMIHVEAVKRPEVALLTSIPGFAEYSALLVLVEIGDYHRFQTAEQFASYAGLVSSTYQSSNTCYQGHITKQGNKMLRWILIECSNITVRKPSSLQRFYLRLKARKGHNKAIVATARKTLTIMWAMLQKQQAFHT